MSRVLLFALIAVMATLGFSETSVAQSRGAPQFSQPVGFHVRPISDLRAEIPPSNVKIQEDEERGRAGIYFLTGAVAGAVVLGGAVTITASNCADDCMLVGPMIGLAAGAGAVAGGLVGLLMYAFRHERWGNQ